MDALIVVDMQKDFCYPDGSLYIGDHVRTIFDPIKKVIETARKKMPIVFTQDWHRRDDPEFRIWRPHCIENTRGAEVIDEINPMPDDYYVKKRKYSAFFATDLDLILRELDVRRIYVVGVVTNICVLHTVADAVMRGYEVYVLKDCTAALTDYEYEYGMKHIKDVLKAKIISSEDFQSSI